MTNPDHLTERATRIVNESRGLLTLIPDMAPEDALRYTTAMVTRLIAIAIELHQDVELVRAEIKRIVPDDIDPTLLDY